MKFIPDNKTALLLIDFQKGFDEIGHWGGGRNNITAENNASKILNYWRRLGLFVFHIKHCSLETNSPLAESNAGNEFKDELSPVPEELIIKKNVNSAFIGTDLKDQLDKLGVNKLLVVGLTTDHCISTSVRMAGNLGFDTYLVNDATATFDKKGFNGEIYPAQLIHDTAIASLNGEFATIINTSDIVDLIN